MAEIFPNLKETDIQVQKHRGFKQDESKQPTPRYIIIKMAKVKENFKGKRKKQSISYKESPIRLSANFSAETLQAKRVWHDIFQSAEREKPAT